MKTIIKRVGIVTLHGYHNYGNKLQNYALLEVLKSLNVDVGTLVFKRNENLFGRLNNFKYISYKEILNRIREKKERKLFYENNKQTIDSRTETFKLFSTTYLNEIYINGGYDKIIEGYDFFITGSDQVWNPIYMNGMDEYFLQFAAKEKRVSYAPSFGTYTIPLKFYDKYRKWLNGMSKISVREEAGASIIKELTGFEVPVLVDPTLLLSKEQWLSIASVAINKPRGDYLLTYFLGEVNKEIELYIQCVAKEKKLTIIRLGDSSDVETYMTGPREFIDFINSASIFLTDSFHGVVFSIILETPFIVYERKTKSATMYSRIETLLDKFSLKQREKKNVKENIFQVDFSDTKKVLNLERQKALDYLRNALDIKN